MTKEESLFKETPDEIIAGLFLGNLAHAEVETKALLAGNYQRVVLRCTKHPIEVDMQQRLDALPKGSFETVLIGDAKNNPISDHFDKAFNFIDNALHTGKEILVHCDAGASRSPSIVIGYLIARRGFSYQDALRLVQEKRPCVEVSNFSDQLLHLENTVKLTKSSARLLAQQGLMKRSISDDDIQLHLGRAVVGLVDAINTRRAATWAPQAHLSYTATVVSAIAKGNDALLSLCQKPEENSIPSTLVSCITDYLRYHPELKQLATQLEFARRIKLQLINGELDDLHSKYGQPQESPSGKGICAMM